MLPKYSLKSPLCTAKFEPIGKLVNLPFSTELSMDLSTRKHRYTVPKERGNL